MKKAHLAFILPFLLLSGSLLANPKTKSASSPTSTWKTWRESPDGIQYARWEASPVGKKVHAGAVKINRAIQGNATLSGVVTSLSLPESSRLGFGIMVNIQGETYILALGGETDLEALKNLHVNDQITIKSHHVSKAPKYAFAILSPAYVIRGSKLMYKRVPGKGGC